MIEPRILPDKRMIGLEAARLGARAIRDAIARDGHASIIVATGASQFELLEELTRTPDLDWTKVTAFHLDEYVGLPKSHRASFRGFLEQRFMAPIGGAARFVPIDGEGDPSAEIDRLNRLIAGRRIAVCFAGIGENCHLAFNDPPADFETGQPYIKVVLDEACRRQQFGEGWFKSLEEVPKEAISMSVRQMLKSELLVICVSDQRKAQAVHDALDGPVTPDHPASILQTHANCAILLDPPAAALLTSRGRRP